MRRTAKRVCCARTERPRGRESARRGRRPRSCRRRRRSERRSRRGSSSSGAPGRRSSAQRRRSSSAPPASPRNGLLAPHPACRPSLSSRRATARRPRLRCPTRARAGRVRVRSSLSMVGLLSRCHLLYTRAAAREVPGPPQARAAVLRAWIGATSSPPPLPRSCSAWFRPRLPGRPAGRRSRSSPPTSSRASSPSSSRRAACSAGSPRPPTRAASSAIGGIGALVAHTSSGRLTLVDSDSRRPLDPRRRSRRRATPPSRPTVASPTSPTRSGRRSPSSTCAAAGSSAAFRSAGPRVTSTLDRARSTALGRARQQGAEIAIARASTIRAAAASSTGSGPPFLAHDVGFTPGGRRVWVTSGDRGRLAIYDDHSACGSCGRSRADAPPQHVTFLGDRAFVTSGDDAAPARARPRRPPAAVSAQCRPARTTSSTASGLDPHAVALAGDALHVQRARRAAARAPRRALVPRRLLRHRHVSGTSRSTAAVESADGRRPRRARLRARGAARVRLGDRGALSPALAPGLPGGVPRRPRRGRRRGHRPGGLPGRRPQPRPLRPPAAVRAVAAPDRRQPRDRLDARAAAARRGRARRIAEAPRATGPARRVAARRARGAAGGAPGRDRPPPPARVHARRDRRAARPAARNRQLAPAPRPRSLKETV